MKNALLKPAFFTVLFSISTLSLFSQDLIVTNNGDSLNCKINSIRDGNIYFTVRDRGEARETYVSLDAAKSYQMDYYNRDFSGDRIKPSYENYPRFRLAVNAGYSYRLARVSENFSSVQQLYLKNLKHGYHYGAELSLFFAEQVGIGFKYYNFRSKNELNDVFMYDDRGNTLHGKISDEMSINFIGPFLTTRFMNQDKRNAWFINLGLGYMGYEDYAVVAHQNGYIKGSTLGTCWDIGYDIRLSENFSLGFQLSLLSGTLTSYTTTLNGMRSEHVELDKDQYEGLGRIDLSIGLRFNK